MTPESPHRSGHRTADWLAEEFRQKMADAEHNPSEELVKAIALEFAMTETADDALGTAAQTTTLLVAMQHAARGLCLSEEVQLVITFGDRYRREFHPTFKEAHPDMVLAVRGEDYWSARELAFAFLQGKFAFDYPVQGPPNMDNYPRGVTHVLSRFGVLTKAEDEKAWRK